MTKTTHFHDNFLAHLLAQDLAVAFHYDVRVDLNLPVFRFGNTATFMVAVVMLSANRNFNLDPVG